MDKNKVLLLISSIFTFLYVLFNIAIIKFTESNISKMTLIFYIIFFTALITGSVLFFFISVSKKDINKFKIPILLFSIVMFINNVISGILGFIVFSKLNKKKLRDLPKLDSKMNNKWYIYLLSFIICILLIFVAPNILKGKLVRYALYLFMIILLLVVFYKDLKRDIKYFFKYFREYNSYVFKMYLFSLLVLLILTIAIRITTNLDNSTNQITLTEQFKETPLLIGLLSVLYAPFVEEILFRGIIRKFINNKWLFIIISGFLFGIAHVIDDFQSIEELLYIFVYGSLGCFMASIYYKTNNIFTNMYFHFIQNSLAIIALILLTYYVH